MNDLPYIFYKPSMMFMDTVGMTKDGKVAHRQLADYVWTNDGPPTNDNDILRDLTSCSAADWARVKRELIGKGWIETSKFFLHKGIVKTLNLSKKKAVESYNKTCAANNLPRHELLDPDPETGVTHIVTCGVTSGNRDRDRDRDITHTPKVDGDGGNAGLDVLADLRSKLNILYRRKESDLWKYAEETELVEVCKREGVIDEYQHILTYRKSLQEPKRFFPQSLYALLDRWTETLDKARVQCPIKKPIAVTVKKTLNEKAISIDDLRSSLKWALANTPGAKENIAVLERRIEEMSK